MGLWFGRCVIDVVRIMGWVGIVGVEMREIVSFGEIVEIGGGGRRGRNC